jgi:pimeloyl-ACP methyl ester carboxylesterase
VFVNPGGPGTSGVKFLRSVVTLLGPLRERFAIVGFDARGAGGSKPAIDCVDDQGLDRLLRTLPTPESGNLDRILRFGRRIAAQCRANTPAALLRRASTADAARDLDRLRALVGDRRLTYIGLSYGTEIGSVYASLFPRRIRALVLDGAIDHRRWSHDAFAQSRGYLASSEAALRRFFAFCSQDRGACPFGDPDPAAAFDALLRRLDRASIRGGDPERKVDDTVARLAALAAMYERSAWPLLGQGLAAADGGDGTILQGIADFLLERSSDGSYSNFLEAFVAVLPLDTPVSQSRAAFARHVRRMLRVSPHFGPLFASIDAIRRELPAARSRFRGPVSNAPRSPTALVIGTTHDNATAYGDAISLTRQLGNARLLTRTGDSHTAWLRSACIDEHVNAYLIAGTLPPPGTRCPTP